MVLTSLFHPEKSVMGCGCGGGGSDGSSPQFSMRLLLPKIFEGLLIGCVIGTLGVHLVQTAMGKRSLVWVLLESFALLGGLHLLRKRQQSPWAVGLVYATFSVVCAVSVLERFGDPI